MNRSQLPLTNEVRFCVSGVVTIHPTAAIATNVVLHANPGSAIAIGPGSVIGKGSIIHAHGGTLNLGTEVTLGTQVLLFGRGWVGSRSCIGSMTTIMGNIQIDDGQIIPPNTLMGVPEPSNSATTADVTNHNGNSVHQHDLGNSESSGPTDNGYNLENRDSMNADNAAKHSSAGSGKGNATANTAAATNPAASHPVVYGQASVQRLITMMFPHRSHNTSEND